MVKRSAQKQRGRNERSTKRFILIGTEGKNKTEIGYFNQFNRIQKNFRVRFSSGNSTDSMGIVADIKRTRAKLKFHAGDLAFAVFDADLWGTRGKQIQQAINYAEKQEIKVILSNPCFEVWFVLHFEDGRAPYDSSDKVIDKLKQYVPDYEKSRDMFEVLHGNMEKAISRAEQLRRYHEDNDTVKLSEQNPMTDVDRLVKLLCGAG